MIAATILLAALAFLFLHAREKIRDLRRENKDLRETIEHWKIKKDRDI